MNTYRAYPLNPAGRIQAGHWFEAQDDNAAKAKALEYCDPSSPNVELWRGTRLVGRVPCEDED